MSMKTDLRRLRADLLDFAGDASRGDRLQRIAAAQALGSLMIGAALTELVRHGSSDDDPVTPGPLEKIGMELARISSSMVRGEFK
jgi:hypothetical protein